jgi:hypothetical protein
MPKKKIYKLKNKILKESKNISNFSKNVDDKIIPKIKKIKKNINDNTEIDNCEGYEKLPSILKPVKTIYAIGDIHGDLKVAVNSLYLCKVIDTNYEDLVDKEIINKEIMSKVSEKDNSNFTSEDLAKQISDKINWTGGESVVVQVGDQVDRCRPKEKMCNEEGATIDDEPSDLLILYFMTMIDKKARKHKGKVISLFGNHELMQTFGNFSYVSKENLDLFENVNDRKKKFSIGEKYSKFMACTRLASVIIGSNIFIHAGIIPEFLKENNYNSNNSHKKIDESNKKIREYLLNKTNSKNIKYIIRNRNSIFWTRILGNIPPNVNNDDVVCEKYLKPVLKIFKCNNMIVGHTPQSFQFHGHGITSTCLSKNKNGLHRVDIGSSKAFQDFDNTFSETSEVMEGRNIQVLKIENDKDITILKE